MLQECLHSTLETIPKKDWKICFWGWFPGGYSYRSYLVVDSKMWWYFTLTTTPMYCCQCEASTNLSSHYINQGVIDIDTWYWPRGLPGIKVNDPDIHDILLVYMSMCLYRFIYCWSFHHCQKCLTPSHSSSGINRILAPVVYCSWFTFLAIVCLLVNQRLING